MKWIVGLVLISAACAGQQKPPLGRAFMDDPPTYVEMLDGVDAGDIWRRTRELLATYHVQIDKERYSNGDGYILCKPFTVVLPGTTVNVADYHPGELVSTKDASHAAVETYLLEIYVSASASGIVRLWSDAEILVDGYGPDEVRLPNLVGANLVAEVVRPLQVVKEWRHDRRLGVSAR